MEILFYQAFLLIIVRINADSVYLNLQPLQVLEGSSVTLDCVSMVDRRGSNAAYYRDNELVVVLTGFDSDCKGDWKVQYNNTRVSCFGNIGVFRVVFRSVTRELDNTRWKCSIHGQRSSNSPRIKVKMITSDPSTTKQSPTTVIQPSSREVTSHRTSPTKQSQSTTTQPLPREVTSDRNGKTDQNPTTTLQSTPREETAGTSPTSSTQTTSVKITAGHTETSPTTSTQATQRDVTAGYTGACGQSPSTMTQPTQGEVTGDHTTSNVLIGVFASGFILLAVFNIVVLIWYTKTKTKTEKIERRIDEVQSANSSAETPFSGPGLDVSNSQPRPDNDAHQPRASDRESAAEVSAPEGHYSALQADAMDYEHMYGVAGEDGNEDRATNEQGDRQHLLRL